MVLVPTCHNACSSYVGTLPTQIPARIDTRTSSEEYRSLVDLDGIQNDKLTRQAHRREKYEFGKRRDYKAVAKS